METKKDIVVKKEEGSVDTFISQALSSGASVEVLERLFALKQRVDEENAKKAFIEAMSKFQKDCPIIEKKRVVKGTDGSIRYKFAPIDEIAKQIAKPLSDNNLSYRWESIVETDKRIVTATCIVTHVSGHSERSSFSAAVDEGRVSRSGFKMTTTPQDFATSLTYAKRYSLLDALGIATGEEDTDATDAGSKKEPIDDKSKIINRLRHLNEKTSTKEEIEEAVKKLTHLSLVSENFEEIVTRLDVVISEAREAKEEVVIV